MTSWFFSLIFEAPVLAAIEICPQAARRKCPETASLVTEYDCKYCSDGS